MLANRTDTIFVRKQTIISLVSPSLARTPVHPDHLCIPKLHNFAFSPFLKRKNYNQTPDILVSLYKHYCNCIGICDNFSLGQRLLVKKYTYAIQTAYQLLEHCQYFNFKFFFYWVEMRTQKISAFKDRKLFITL